MSGEATYTEVLDVAQDLVVQGEVVGWDEVDAGVFLDLPVGQPQPLGLREELISGDLAAPVCISLSANSSRPLPVRSTQVSRVLVRLTSLSSLLEVTVDSHARETENGGLDHFDRRCG